MNTNNAALALATYNTMIAAAETSAIAWRQVGIDPWASWPCPRNASCP